MHRDSLDDADEGYVLEALTAGASVYVLKKSTTGDLVKAIRDAIAGRRFLSPPLSEHLIDAYVEKAKSAPFDSYNTLTPPSERSYNSPPKVTPNAAIATRLSISPRTWKCTAPVHAQTRSPKSHRTGSLRLAARNPGEREGDASPLHSALSLLLSQQDFRSSVISSGFCEKSLDRKSRDFSLRSK